MKRTLSFVGAALTVAVLLLPASPADAAFPGANGDLVFARFTHGQNDLWAPRSPHVGVDEAHRFAATE